MNSVVSAEEKRTKMSNTIAAKQKNTPGNAGDAIVVNVLAL